MDCNRAWDLMMKEFDNELEPYDRQQLLDHLEDCTLCKNQHSALAEAFTAMREIRDEAPFGIEAKVMDKIRKFKHREADLHKFIITPAILFFVLAALPLQLLKIGPITLLDKVFQVLGFIQSVIKTISALLIRVLEALYIKEAILFLMLGAAALGAYYLVKSFVKYNESMTWRISK